MSHTPEHQSVAGRARAARASRGSAGQFIPAETQPENPAASREASLYLQPRPKSHTSKPLTLKTLHQQTEWWDALAAQYPNVNLERELLKAMDWHGADRVKSPKLFFRNWVERASHWAAPVELTPDQVRERLRVVS